MILIPNLEVDRDGDDPDTHVMLTQDFGGNQHFVSLHPCQIQLLAERMGLLVPDAEAQRAIVRLSRQMRLLLERISFLTDYLHDCSDTAHADLSYEQAYSMATWELAREFCKDLPDVEPKAAAAKPTIPAKLQSEASDRTNAERQRRHRERQKQQRNGASVTPVTDSRPVTVPRTTP